MKENLQARLLNRITRRKFLAGTALAGIATTLTGATAYAGKKNKPMKTNGKLYEGGAMSIDKVKQAYLDMMNRFNYPIPDILKTDNFWVCDFDQSSILALGMGGIFWINQKGDYKTTGAGVYSGDYEDERFGYLLHEIYLLPGQTLPEHSHLGGPEEYPPKLESWQVRYGEVNFFGEYKHGDELLISDLPKSDQPWGFGEDWFKSKYIAKRDARTNQMYTLHDPESWHGQLAGPEGAIVTEVATYHNHVQFSKPGMSFKNTGH